MEATGQEAEPSTTDLLVELLRRTEQAHGLHERETGQRDADWPRWYAQYMVRALREAGYRISRTP